MKNHFIIKAQLCAIVMVFLNCGNHPENLANPAPKASVKTEISDLSKYLKTKGISKGALLLLIDKSDKKLYVMHEDKTLKSYPVSLGSTNIADKRMQGDNLTPEGDFLIRAKYPHQSWKYFLWINYPTADSERKHSQAKKAGLIPRNAGIGGEIGIHGVVDGSDYLVSGGIPWTKGCISLKNKDIEEIYEITACQSTTIRIRR
jgi:murein L,D-transpeptidase YafK